MLENYIILMSRKYKSWGGLSWLNLIGLIGIYGLIFILIRGFMANPDLVSLVIILLILFVATVAYVNYVTLQLRNRTKEFYVRKIFGASDAELTIQVLLESFVLTSFLVVSGMVLAELVSPLCGKILGAPILLDPIGLFGQILIAAIMVLPVGLAGVLLPVRKYLHYIKTNFSKLSHRTY
jgi:ABC-type antimicrobial peptide transport system permease subunit